MWVERLLCRVFPKYGEPLVTEAETTLGNMLLGMGMVTPQDIEEALVVKSAMPGTRIGFCLVDLGHITEDELATVLGLQKDIRNGGAIKAKVAMIEKLLEVRHG